jgi:hypothetical protein
MVYVKTGRLAPPRWRGAIQSRVNIYLSLIVLKYKMLKESQSPFSTPSMRQSSPPLQQVVHPLPLPRNGDDALLLPCDEAALSPAPNDDALVCVENPELASKSATWRLQ